MVAINFTKPPFWRQKLIQISLNLSKKCLNHSQTTTKTKKLKLLRKMSQPNRKNRLLRHTESLQGSLIHSQNRSYRQNKTSIQQHGASKLMNNRNRLLRVSKTTRGGTRGKRTKPLDIFKSKVGMIGSIMQLSKYPILIILENQSHLNVKEQKEQKKRDEKLQRRLVQTTRLANRCDNLFSKI